MKPKGMKIEMSRVTFGELFKYMEKVKTCHAAKNAFFAATLIQQTGLPSLYIANDFIERNAAKYAKVGNVVDEVVQFPVLTIVRFACNEQGVTSDNNEYVVIRAKKLPSGKREYWLWRHGQRMPASGSLIRPDRKVSGASIRGTGHTVIPDYFSGRKMPKEI